MCYICYLNFEAQMFYFTKFSLTEKQFGSVTKYWGEKWLNNEFHLKYAI